MIKLEDFTCFTKQDNYYNLWCLSMFQVESICHASLVGFHGLNLKPLLRQYKNCDYPIFNQYFWTCANDVGVLFRIMWIKLFIEVVKLSNHLVKAFIGISIIELSEIVEIKGVRLCGINLSSRWCRNLLPKQNDSERW